MHKFIPFYLILIVIVLWGCASKKTTVILPCETESADDALYIRELGHGVSVNLQLARRSSMNDAQLKIINRLCDSIRIYLPHVYYNSFNDSISIGLTDSILFIYPISYFGELTYTRKECEKVTYDANNQYHCFITLAIPREDIEQANNKVHLEYLNYMADTSNEITK